MVLARYPLVTEASSVGHPASPVTGATAEVTVQSLKL